MTSIPKFSNIILCEYITVGMGNKHTLINVYSGDIIVQSLPNNLMFALYLEFKIDENKIEDISVDLLLNRKVFGKITTRISATDNEYNTDILDDTPKLIVIPGFQIGIPHESVLEARVRIGSGRPKTLLSKRITVGAIPGFPIDQ